VQTFYCDKTNFFQHVFEICIFMMINWERKIGFLKTRMFVAVNSLFLSD